MCRNAKKFANPPPPRQYWIQVKLNKRFHCVPTANKRFATLGTIKSFAKCRGDEKCNRNLYKNSLNKTIRCRLVEARWRGGSNTTRNKPRQRWTGTLACKASENSGCFGWKSERCVWCPFPRSFVAHERRPVASTTWCATIHLQARFNKRRIPYGLIANQNNYSHWITNYLIAIPNSGYYLKIHSTARNCKCAWMCSQMHCSYNY